MHLPSEMLLKVMGPTGSPGVSASHRCVRLKLEKNDYIQWGKQLYRNIKAKLHTLDLNKDILLLTSRSVGSLQSVEATVSTVSIPDK